MTEPGRSTGAALCARPQNRATGQGRSSRQVQPNLKRAAIVKRWAGPAAAAPAPPRRRHLSFDLPISRISFPANFCNCPNKVLSEAATNQQRFRFIHRITLNTAELRRLSAGKPHRSTIFDRAPPIPQSVPRTIGDSRLSVQGALCL